MRVSRLLTRSPIVPLRSDLALPGLFLLLFESERWCPLLRVGLTLTPAGMPNPYPLSDIDS